MYNEADQLEMTDSDVVYMNLLGKHIVVLNSDKATKELLEKRSALFSDRYAT